MKKHAYSTLILSMIALLLVIMIGIGAQGKALAVKQEVFQVAKNSVLSTEPSDYLKGAINHKKIKLDMSAVAMDKPGKYAVSARQSGRVYEFYIEVK